jgi:predicted N-acetyltransferase YhbS
MIIIRPETSDDLPKIYRLVKTAFETAPHAEGDEQDFVERQRRSDGYIAELSLVAEIEGRIIAHLMMTRIFVFAPGPATEILLLAAVSVQMEWRNKGLGSRLITHAFQRAVELGHRAVLVVGDPNFYRRFGFRPSVDYAISNTNRIEPRYVQALELKPGSLRAVAGSVSLPS